MSEQIGYTIRQGFIPYEQSALEHPDSFKDITENSLKKIGHCVIFNFKYAYYSENIGDRSASVPIGFRPKEAVTFHAKGYYNGEYHVVTCTVSTNGRLSFDGKWNIMHYANFEICNVAWEINPNEIMEV